MKQTFTLLLAFFISVSSYAYPAFSKLSIASTSQTPIRVMVDGNRYKASNNHALMLANLQPGYHNIKIYQFVKNFKPAPGSTNNNYRLVYNSNVYVKPNFHVDITVNRFGRAFKDEQPIVSTYNDDDDEWTDDNWNNGNGGNNDWNDNNWDTDWNNNNNGNNNSSYNRAMNTQQFDRFKTSLKNENFDETRVNIAKQVINTNYLTTAQVKEMLGYFSFENNKLEMAKFAYKNTVDKKEYYSVGDVFSFSSNKDELMKYIQNYK